MIEDERAEDMCPICKTDRYLSPDMKFLVNPECYHKMCESCVDRIYSLGPAPCPYPGCGKTLRKNRFKLQIFDDIFVEKEVDIRKRVGLIFNKTLDQFDSLHEYNSYLEEIEDIVFNLVNSVEVEATEEKLSKYKEMNQDGINENNLNKEKELQDFVNEQERQKELKQQKLLLEKQIEDEEKKESEEAKREILNKLSTNDVDASTTINQVKKSVLKRSSARRKQLAEIMKSLNSNPKNNKKIKQEVIPFTPFNGDRSIIKQFNVQNQYYDPFIDELKAKKDYIAAGFRAELVYERVLNEAFMGLGCVISKERAII